MKLISLLYYERHNEVPYVKNAVLGRGLLIGFVLTGIGSGLIFYFQPLGNYCDILLGFGMMAISCFAFFIGGMAVLYHRLEVNRKWAYQGNHLFIYRNFVSQARKSALSFGMIAAVFAIGMVLISTGASYHIAVNELTDQESFDLMILHMNEEFDFSEYAEYLENTAKVDSSYTYNLYTTRKQDYIELRNQALSDYFISRRLEVTPKEYLYTENRFDTYMKYSDYCRLREMLGLEQGEMGENQYLIHCMPYLREPLAQALQQTDGLKLSGSVLVYAGIYTEKFSLYDGYGNGQELLIVVPDECVSNMDVLYGLYTANLGEDVNLKYLKAFCDRFNTLEMMDVNYVDGTVSDTESYMTRLPSYSKDYLHGRYVLFAERIEVMLILSLIYLGIVLFVAGTVIFSVRLLSEIREQMKYYRMLGILGMNRKQIVKTLRKQILLNFIFSLIAYLPLSIGVVYITSSMIINQYFLVPVFDSILVPIATILGVSVGVFLLIYALYGILVFYIAKKEILKVII
ncbi:MAG: ABC transporter permease [Eubacteriales bacterium]|nr:ABC transporter permease [Eubacteriales bacterium]